MAIFHPPCTDLAASGARWWPEKQADGRQAAAIAFFMRLLGCGIERIAVENPVGVIGSRYEKPAQIINPWQFGDPFNKKTCIWLRGLEPLTPTDVVEPTANWINGSTYGGSGKRSALADAPSHRSEKIRSQFFPGIAAAMADQWGAAA